MQGSPGGDGKIEREGRIEGKLEGKAEGIIVAGLEYGASEENILEKLQSKLNISLQEAQEYLDRFMEHTI